MRRVSSYGLLDAVKTSLDPFLFPKNITKMILVPNRGFSRKIFNRLPERASLAPSLNDNSHKRNIRQPKTLEFKGSRQKHTIGRISLKKHRAMVRHTSSEVSNSHIRVEGIPARIGEEMVNSFLDEITNIPSICPSETRPNKSHINHRSMVKALFEEKGPIRANASSPKFIPFHKNLIKIPSNNLRFIMKISSIF